MDPDRLQYVTRRYPHLQGLRLLPLAALFLLSALWRAGWMHLPGDDRPLVAARWFVAGLAIAVGASYPLRAWYSARFGTLSQRVSDSPLATMVTFIASLPLAIAIQGEARLTVLLPVALLAAVLAGVGIGHYPLRRHYLGAAAVLFVLALLPDLGVPADVLSVLFDAAIGVALVVVGVGDHRLLTATLQEVHADV